VQRRNGPEYDGAMKMVYHPPDTMGFEYRTQSRVSAGTAKLVQLYRRGDLIECPVTPRAIDVSRRAVVGYEGA